MKFVTKGLMLGVALALAVPATAGADTIISTLANVGSEAGTDVNAETNAAQGFIVGSQSELLQSVTLDLKAGNGTATVSILNDNGFDSPGTLALSLGTITPTGSGFAEYTVNAPSALTLLSNMTYWVAVAYDHTVSPSNPGPWAFANPLPPFGSGIPATGSGTLGPIGFSFDGGATWGTFPSATAGPYIVEVNGVPEPSTLVSAAIAVLFGIGVTVHTRYKRKAVATV